MPVAARTVDRHLPSFIPGQRLEPGFDDNSTLSTRHQRFTRVRLTSRHLTDLVRLFRNAHHPSHGAGAACGGLNPDPAIRVRGAHPHLLCSKAAQSWFYIVTSSSRRRGAPSSANRTRVRGREWDISGSQAIRPVPLLRSRTRPNLRSLAITVSPTLPLLFRRLTGLHLLDCSIANGMSGSPIVTATVRLLALSARPLTGGHRASPPTYPAGCCKAEETTADKGNAMQDGEPSA
jgi:hypothetical protein